MLNYSFSKKINPEVWLERFVMFLFQIVLIKDFFDVCSLAVVVAK